jgi:O-antigen/teichoic acid export membrane protein
LVNEGRVFMKERLALLRNVVMLSAASYVEMALGLALGVVVARALGSADFGHYAFAVWVCGTLMTLGNNALTMCAIRFIAEARGLGQTDTAAALHAHLQRWHGLSSGLVLTVFALGVWAHPPHEWAHSFLLMVPLMVVGAWSRTGYAMLTCIAKGHERFEVESIALVFSAVVNLSLVLLLAASGGELIAFVAVYAVCGLVQNLVARVVLRRYNIRAQRQPLSPELTQRLKRYLLQSSGLILLGLMSDRTLEVLLLKNFATSQAVGFFAIAGALTKGATYVLAGALSSVLLPAMSRAFGRGGAESVSNMLRESMRYYWFIGLTIAGLGLVVAPGLVRLLYGAQYEGAVLAVTVNLLVSGGVLVSSSLNAFHTSSDRQFDRLRIAGMALVINAITACALVPRWGLNGALGSIAITNVAGVTISWLFARRAAKVALPLAMMLRVLVAALVAAGLALALLWGLAEWRYGRFVFIPAGLIFVVTYSLLSVVLRAWGQADYALIAAAATRLGAPGRGISNWVLAAQKRFSK